MWYGDPSGRILYWPKLLAWSEQGNISLSCIDWDKDDDPGSLYSNVKSHDGWKLIPHMFDLLVGIDEGLTNDSDF